MRAAFKRIASRILMPITRFYLRTERTYRYRDITVRVTPGVFHPGLFSSTRFLLSHIEHEDLRGSKFLEVGCGTGLISVAAAKKGADVTALDINATAVRNAEQNFLRNHVRGHVLESDLFDALTCQHFDYIAINPPYYARDPADEGERAWYCGANFEYFEKLFSTLSSIIHADSNIIMVLTKGCNLTAIFSIAQRNGFSFQLISEKSVLFDEKDYLFRILQFTTSP